MRLGRLLLGTVTKDGLQQVSLNRDGHRRVAYVHRLVALAFFGPPPPGCVIRHLNGDKLDNRAANLVWYARNAIRRLGEANPNAKLNSEKVREMRQLRNDGERWVEIGRRFGVTTSAAYRVVTGRDWRHIP